MTIYNCLIITVIELYAIYVYYIQLFYSIQLLCTTVLLYKVYVPRGAADGAIYNNSKNITITIMHISNTKATSNSTTALIIVIMVVTPRGAADGNQLMK